jgi:hypothetical protein
MKNSVYIFSSEKLALILLLVSFFALPKKTLAQRSWKDYLITGSSVLVSGMLDGTIETLSYHYDTGFKNRFPAANTQFWDPSVSWKNKYRNGDYALGPKFWGSTNVFACTTDGYHMLRTIKRTDETFALAYYVRNTCSRKPPGGNKWKNTVTDFLVLTAIRCAGFSLTYTVIFNPNRDIIKM